MGLNGAHPSPDSPQSKHGPGADDWVPADLRTFFGLGPISMELPATRESKSQKTGC